MGYKPKSETIKEQLFKISEAMPILDAATEKRIKAELILQFGLSHKRANDYMAAMYETGRFRKTPTDPIIKETAVD